MKWRNQDWYWLTGILIIIIIFILAFRLSDNVTFMNVFSFMASGVSIALAFVAMYTSFKQNSDNQTLTTQMNETLARMDEKINNMDNKVSEFNIGEFRKILDEKIISTSKTIEDTLQDDDGNVSKYDVLEILNEELSKFRQSFDNVVDNINTGKYYGRVVLPQINSKEILSVIMKDFIDTDFSLMELTRTLSNNNIDISLSSLRKFLDDLVNINFLEKQRIKDEERKRYSYRYKLYKIL